MLITPNKAVENINLNTGSLSSAQKVCMLFTYLKTADYNKSCRGRFKYNLTPVFRTFDPPISNPTFFSYDNNNTNMTFISCQSTVQP